MKYSVPKAWDGSFERDGVLYFAQRLEEMLFNYTIDLFRMPLLNTHGLADEYCSTAEKVSKNEVKEYQLEQVYDELIYSFKGDIVLKECWGQQNIDRVIKSFGSSSQQEKLNTISFLGAIFDNFKYYTWCEQTLKKYTNQPKKKKKIEAAIRCWIPEVISLGYSADYIYSELKSQFFSNKPVNEGSVNDFFALFNFKAHEYSVYFSVSKVVLNFQDILKKRLRVQFDDDGNFLYFRKDRNKVIIYFNKIKAPCPNTAVAIAYKRLDLFFSFYKFVGNKRLFSIQKKAMVLEKDSEPIFVDAHQFSYSIIEDIDFKEIGTASDIIITGLLNNAASEYSLLRKSIELHNTALAVPDLKSGFLNLWASIEVLCQSQNEGSKFKCVLKNVVPVLKKDFLNTVIDNIYVGLKDNVPKKEYRELLDSVTEVECEDEKIYYLLLLPKYNVLLNKCLEILANYPILRSRMAFISEMNTTTKLKEYIDKYVKRITWHLYRMYRTRNAIIHSGEVPSNIKYLGEHLHSYVDSTLLEFIVKLSVEVPLKSTNNVITDVKFAICNIENALCKGKPVDQDIINILIHPEIGYTIRWKENTSQE